MDTGKPLSQSLRLLELVKSRPFTTLDARRMGIMNCSQRITDLRKLGHPNRRMNTDTCTVSLNTFGTPYRKGRPTYGIKI